MYKYIFTYFDNFIGLTGSKKERKSQQFNSFEIDVSVINERLAFLESHETIADYALFSSKLNEADTFTSLFVRRFIVMQV